MKVFISWSGDLSRNVATILRDWLPAVIQSVEPYVSSEDIDKGTRWSSDISGELEASSFGILCITSANLQAPWINFEAGALSKSVESSRVSPFLFNVKRSDIAGPLVQFQSTVNEKEDIFKLVTSLNDAEEKSLAIDRLKVIFEVWWPKLEEALSKLPQQTEGATKKTSEKKKELDILEEVLEIVRAQTLLLRDPEKLFPPGYVEHLFSQSKDAKRGAPQLFLRPIVDMTAQIARFRLSLSDDVVRSSEVMEFLSELDGPVRYMERHLKNYPFD
jgi:hypothetical protein